MKIYTRTGDDGTTGLVGGSRVVKSDPRIDCYGTIDELNAGIGIAAVTAAGEMLDRLGQVQRDLFVIGSHLATPEGSAHRASLPAFDENMVARLEREIDQAEANIPSLRNFILPGGTETAARLHLARTVCRRAERLFIASALERSAPLALMYLNRLSDWLFVQARAANHSAGVADIPWIP